MFLSRSFSFVFILCVILLDFLQIKQIQNQTKANQTKLKKQKPQPPNWEVKERKDFRNEMFFFFLFFFFSLHLAFYCYCTVTVAKDVKWWYTYMVSPPSFFFFYFFFCFLPPPQRITNRMSVCISLFVVSFLFEFTKEKWVFNIKFLEKLLIAS